MSCNPTDSASIDILGRQYELDSCIDRRTARSSFVAEMVIQCLYLAVDLGIGNIICSISVNYMDNYWNNVPGLRAGRACGETDFAGIVGRAVGKCKTAGILLSEIANAASEIAVECVIAIAVALPDG